MDNEKIRAILTRQMEESKKVYGKNYVERDSIFRKSSFFEAPQAKIIIGPRRAGKSVLVFLLLKEKDFYYINFDDETLSKLDRTELGDILTKLHEYFGDKKVIFLDEIQNIEGWELFVNRILREDYNVFISGSNSHLLSSDYTTHLGGRFLSIEQLPFSFREFLRYKNFETDVLKTSDFEGNIKHQLREYILFGGYPEILKFQDEELAKNYYESLINTILFKDISKRHNLKYIEELKAILTIISKQFSFRTSLRKIATEIGMSTMTVKKYTSHLEDAYLILSSKKFSYKPREMESSMKKYYGIDTGMLNFLRVGYSDDFGRMMENIAAIEIKRKGFELCYYMPDNKYEVDFLLQKNGIPNDVIQVCFDNEKIPSREISSGLLACKKLKLKSFTIITWNEEKNDEKDNIKIKYIPLWKWLLRTDETKNI